MSDVNSALQPGSAPKRGKKYFTLGDARRALPYVKRIARDIQDAQENRLRLHTELGEGTNTSPDRARRLQAELGRETGRLEALVDELQKAGVELKDPARGLLDFPSMHKDREILLCWKSGEETITHWHEVNTGYAGRRPVEELEGRGRS